VSLGFRLWGPKVVVEREFSDYFGAPPEVCDLDQAVVHVDNGPCGEVMVEEGKSAN